MICFVPGCTNKSKFNPNTKFFTVPYSKERLEWFAAVGISTDYVDLKKQCYCCENHIQLILDSVNGAQMIHNNTKIGLPLKKYQDHWNVENVKPKTKPADSSHLYKSQLCLRSNCTQTTRIESLDHSTQTASIENKDNSTQTTDRYRVSTSLSTTFSSVTTITDRSSNLEEYIPESFTEATDDDSVHKFSICHTTLSIMKTKPKHYMGINKKCLHIVTHLVNKTQLTEVQVMLTLRKIRLNEEFETLGDLFDIDRRTAGKYFSKSVGPIAKCLKKFLKYVKPTTIKRNLPISFRRNFNRIGAILDCFEIQIERPSRPKKQAKSWSNYKKCNTLKYLICVTPDGLIYYVSLGYGGRSSDLIITTVSKLQKCLKTDFYVMADRGFKGIEDVLIKKGSKLFRPPISTGNQMTKKDVKLTKQIASLRIHVERGIGRVRDFNMCKPHITVDSKLVKHIDNVVKIACGLANLQHQLIKTN